MNAEDMPVIVIGTDSCLGISTQNNVVLCKDICGSPEYVDTS